VPGWEGGSGGRPRERKGKQTPSTHIPSPKAPQHHTLLPTYNILSKWQGLALTLFVRTARGNIPLSEVTNDDYKLFMTTMITLSLATSLTLWSEISRELRTPISGIPTRCHSNAPPIQRCRSSLRVQSPSLERRVPRWSGSLGVTGRTYLSLVRGVFC
jgi:hypothetical protein